jgi:hypothetical protein
MSLTKVSYSMIQGAVINVLDFGATGNGSTDDTTAIQAALDSITTSGTVFFPAGTYIASTLSLSKSCSLVGAEYSSTTLKLKNSATANTDFITTNYQNNIKISGLFFDGNGANQSYTADNGQNGILVRNSQNVIIAECRFKDWGKDGVLLYSDAPATDPVANVTIANNIFENPRRAGVTCISGNDIIISNNQFYGLNAYGAVVTNAGVTWEPDIAADSLNNFIVNGNTFVNMRAGCRLTDSSAVGPAINNIIVSNNIFKDISEEAAIVAYRLLNAGITVTSNRFKTCGNVSASANFYRNAGGVYFSDTNFAVINDNSFDQCTNNGYGTVYADGTNDFCVIKNNTFRQDGKNGIQINRNSALTRGDGTFKQITGNILYGGGTDAANTYTAILVNSTGGAGGGILDTVSNNSIKTSTTVSYGFGIVINQDSGSSQVFGNQISGNGVFYTASVTPGQFIYTAPSTACTDALTNSIVWTATKVQNVVTLTFPNIVGTTTNVAYITFGATLPASFRPTASAAIVCVGVLVNNSPIATPGYVEVRTDGVIKVWRDYAGTAFGTAANTGVASTTVSYIV